MVRALRHYSDVRSIEGAFSRNLTALLCNRCKNSVTSCDYFHAHHCPSYQSGFKQLKDTVTHATTTAVAGAVARRCSRGEAGLQ